MTRSKERCSSCSSSLGNFAPERFHLSSQEDAEDLVVMPGGSAVGLGRHRDRGLIFRAHAAAARDVEAGGEHGDAHRGGAGVGEQFDGASGAGGEEAAERSQRPGVGGDLLENMS